jgi:hypothetical protein
LKSACLRTSTDYAVRGTQVDIQPH